MKRGDSKNYILAFDPSITAWGWVVLEPNGKVVDFGCFKTSPENKVRKIRKGDDTVRRIGEILEHFIKVIDQYRIRLIVTEMPHGSQNASGAQMIGICLGLVASLGKMYEIPVEWYTEGECKKNALNKRSATKKEMIEAMDKFYDVPWKGVKYHDEAVADAISIYHMARSESSILKFLL